MIIWDVCMPYRPLTYYHTSNENNVSSSVNGCRVCFTRNDGYTYRAVIFGNVLHGHIHRMALCVSRHVLTFSIVKQIVRWDIDMVDYPRHKVHQVFKYDYGAYMMYLQWKYHISVISRIVTLQLITERQM